jgi:hypothetical protein
VNLRMGKGMEKENIEINKVYGNKANGQTEN